MAEIVSAQVEGGGGYGYFNRYTGKYYGTGKEYINGSRSLGRDGRPKGTTAGKVRKSMQTVSGRQMARMPRVLRR